MTFGRIISFSSILCFNHLIIPVVLPLASASSHGSFGGHHSRRYAAYDYDLTTPQFTPDGRLLQVEYATKACVREDSNPIVSVGVSAPDGSDTVLIMATISQPPPSSTSTSLSTTQANQHRKDIDELLEQQDEDKVNSYMKGGNQRAQFRIIEVPLSVYYSSSLQQTTTSTILVGLSGLLSDATALLHTIYSHLEDEQRMLGWHRLGCSPVGIIAVDEHALTLSRSKECQPIFTQPSETVLRLSQAISDKCQKHAFGGGLRPLGASLLLAGVDTCPDMNEGSNNMHGARMAMSETHPNGGWRKSVYTERNSVNVSPQIIVTGGSIQSQQRLKRLIRNRFDQGTNGVAAHPNDKTTPINKHDDKAEDLYLRQMLRTVLSSLVDEWKNRGYRSVSSVIDAPEQTTLPTTLPQMEVVVTSSKRGTIRLTEYDVVRLMSQIHCK